MAERRDYCEETVYGVGNRKDEMVARAFAETGVEDAEELAAEGASLVVNDLGELLP